MQNWCRDVHHFSRTDAAFSCTALFYISIKPYPNICKEENKDYWTYKINCFTTNILCSHRVVYFCVLLRVLDVMELWYEENFPFLFLSHHLWPAVMIGENF